MTENAFFTIFNGLRILKRHPILLIPAAIHHIAILFLTLLFIILVLNFGFLNPNYFEISSLLFYLTAVFLTIFVSSFATAGSIGMAKEVIETGSTQLKQLFVYGKKFVLKLVLAFLFITVLRAIFSFFWQPVLNKIGYKEYNAEYIIYALSTDPFLLLPMFEVLAAPVLIAVSATAAYLILISFMFYFVSYIIVIENMSVFKSYRRSFKLLWRRPIRIISFVVLVTAVQILVTLVSILLVTLFNHLGLSFLFGIISNLIFMILLSAAMNIWVTRFYLTLTKKKIIVVQ